MAAKICADIKPTGLRQRDLADIFYQIIYSLKGICTKLDADGGVPLTTYVANCITGCFNCVLEDSKGNSLNAARAATTTIPETVFISPRGMGGREIVDLLYMIYDSLETLTEQLDTDVLTDSDYEATCYTATVDYTVTNSKSQVMGVGLSAGEGYMFHTGSYSQKELIDALYEIVYSISLLTAKLDADGTVTDTNYTALWYTATITLTIENQAGSRIGN